MPKQTRHGILADESTTWVLGRGPGTGSTARFRAGGWPVAQLVPGTTIGPPQHQHSVRVAQVPVSWAHRQPHPHWGIWRGKEGRLELSSTPDPSHLQVRAEDPPPIWETSSSAKVGGQQAGQVGARGTASPAGSRPSQGSSPVLAQAPWMPWQVPSPWVLSELIPNGLPAPRHPCLYAVNHL